MTSFRLTGWLLWGSPSVSCLEMSCETLRSPSPPYLLWPANIFAPDAASTTRLVDEQLWLAVPQWTPLIVDTHFFRSQPRTTSTHAWAFHFRFHIVLFQVAWHEKTAKTGVLDERMLPLLCLVPEMRTKSDFLWKSKETRAFFNSYSCDRCQTNCDRESHSSQMTTNRNRMPATQRPISDRVLSF